MTYFSKCRTMEDIKKTYKELAKQFHPGLGGDTATMQKINSAYAYTCAHFFRNAGMNKDETNTGMTLSELYRIAIEKIIHLPNVQIELVGQWIWVTGNTRPVRTDLKKAGFFYASRKYAWYFRADEFKTRGGTKTLEEIRHKYGTERIHSKHVKTIFN